MEGGDKTFKYHSGNKCYKTYVMKQTLEKMRQEEDADAESREQQQEIESHPSTSTAGTSRVTRSQGSSERSEPCK